MPNKELICEKCKGRYRDDRRRIHKCKNLAKSILCLKCKLVISKVNISRHRKICEVSKRIWIQSPTEKGRYIKQKKVKITSIETDNKRIVEMEKWQQHFINQNLNTKDDRKVIIILDSVGNTGKSHLLKQLLKSHRAILFVPKFSKFGNTADELLNKFDGEYDMLLIDLPRASTEHIDRKHLKDLFELCENVKDGEELKSVKMGINNTIKFSKNAHVIISTNTKYVVDKAADYLSKDRIVKYDVPKIK